ncbi:adventurous gliding motility lipoprotein CglB [Archangium lansingense]|uniref:Adventurous gliding motility lipoprotein CglB n=1 Tax=Archangium lansingense TaxID=2995310 RepID=A0ABT4ANC2_9BACT|nr:adventurous gliding motility lipoprotein CglB [Archangium lansinium]MCY1082344.1 adventurous gliding motility lipoprotein CglB [Archangium lansinium]
MNAKGVFRVGRGFGLSGGVLVLCLLGGVLATGCRVVDPPDQVPDAGMNEPDAGMNEPDAGMNEPDAGMNEPDAGTVLAQVEVGAYKPNLMLLVDTSGSMTNPVDMSDPDCRPGGVLCGDSRPCNTAVCPTRWSALQGAMHNFLSTSGTIARFGLATYPSDDTCGASTAISVPLPDPAKEDEATLEANADQVRNKLLSIKNYSTTEPMPQGGTPTGQSLQFMGTRPELQAMGREDFVLLLTDGLPNCNSNYPASAECFCTLSDCTHVQNIGCLDKDASVEAVQALRAKEIRTIVIGFGADFDANTMSGSKGAETLNGMAVAGGFSIARTCTSDAQCGTGDQCDTAAKLCKRRFYQASNQSELSSSLQQIVDTLQKASCLVRLADAGSYTQESLVVSLDGQVLAPGESSWSLTSEGVRFTGTACEQLEAATPAAPVLVEVQVRG